MPARSPYLFDDFFTSGLEESISPFLETRSKRWAKNIHLKSSLLSASFLLLSFISSFFHPDLSNGLLLIVYFFSGTPALLNTLEDVKNLEINIDMLMTLAAFLSFAIGSGLEGGLLLVLFAFSGAMENTVSKRAKGALLNLNQLTPTIATIIESDGTFIERSVREITPGTRLLVKAGEGMPLDGFVSDGKSFVNLIHLTGESIPISKKKGDEVQAGSRNLDGTLTITVNRTSGDSTLSQIIRLINEAQEMKPKVQRFLDRFGKIYAITIISLFFFFSLTFPFFFGFPFFGIEGSIYRSLAFLIAASPCALIIATPTAYLSAINACARKGIVLKGGITLDALASCKTIAFDKTGTLTTGELSCISAEILIDEKDCALTEGIAIAAALERNATHPMATAICAYAEKTGLSPVPIEDFKSISGFGLQGMVMIKNQSIPISIGNKEFIFPKLSSPISESSPFLKHEYMVSFLLIGKTLFSFHFIDTVRPNVPAVLKKLKEKHHLHLIMLTGDHEKSASWVAKEVGIDRFFADLRPEHKLQIVSDLALKQGLAMVGDGINDAPSLTRATVGISMGKIGSATAIDASDIVFLHDDLSLIEWLYAKGIKTTKIVRQNLALALGVILFATTPALIGYIPLWLAVILHEGGTVLVGLNSLRLLKK